MNSTRFRYWFLSVPITTGVVGVTWIVVTEWAIVAHHDASSFYWIVWLIGVFVLAGGIYGGEKLYQKYKDP